MSYSDDRHILENWSYSDDRHILENWYSSPFWKMKVDKMSDTQVHVKLQRLREASEWRKKHHE